MRTREKRHAVRLSARMRSDTGWTDVYIQNVSGRGMMLSCTDDAPPLNACIEVRRGPVEIVARIVWRDGNKAGVRSQDRIDLKQLISTSVAATIEAAANDDRRARQRTPRAGAAERSRFIGQMMQFLFLLAAAGAGAVALASSVTSTLAPLRTIQATLVTD